ncbi:hypothetical protein [Edaphobacillus lindanitolerans]|uniref:Lipoprotein n=1 Tax=Edaphobacillus lindanitolerans TaxID=550447 RepID=A0A1U7PR31_9BACI|nr:hypothetical protein [Edaphobacillus lindanitolerans]SIT91628.1 hypothetical protein SAMN05428946_2714 [Edaphobacillus lindanitolerans]
MKKIIAILAAAMLLLAACGESEEKKNDEPEKKETSAAPKEEKAEPAKEKAEEPKEESEEVDTQKVLEKALKKKLGDEFISLNGVFVGDEYFGQIELKGTESMTPKLTVKSMKLSIRDALYVIRDSKVGAENFSNIGVSVKYPLVSADGKTADEYVIKSDFTGETVAKLDGANQNNIQDFASDWWEHPAVQQ